MRKAKRLIALLTVAMFLFSFAAPSYAKTADEAVDRLNALGIVVGYGDGSFKPEQNITRAEYAAIVVQALGLGKAAEYVKGNTKFKDVPASHWASGVINIAVEQKILAGYPDGTFKPDQNVTYNEAITMVVRMLGYYDAIKNPVYPTSFVAKAAELKLLDNMVITDYNAPATRGNVFILADDALDTEMWGLKETNDKGEQVYGKLKTLLEEKQQVTEIKDQLVVGVTAVDHGIEADEIILEDPTDGKVKYELKTVSNLLGFYGLKVKAYINKDNKVISLKKDEDEVFTDKIKTLDLGNNKITFYGAGTKNTVASNVYVYRNFGSAATANPGSNIYEGDFVTVVMDGGKVSKLIVSYNTGYGIVDKVTDNKIEFKDEPSATDDINLKDADMDYVQIYRNGKLAKLSDIKAGDLVTYKKSNGDKWLIIATDKVVEGKLNGVASAAGDTFKLTVGDQAIYSSHNFSLQYSTDAGDEYSTATLNNLNDDVVGENVKVYCDPNGEALLVVAGAPSGSADSNKVVVRNITAKQDVSGNTNSVTKYIKVTKADGTDVTYEIDNDDYVVPTSFIGDDTAVLDLDKDSDSDSDNDPANDNDIAPKALAKISLNSAGKVTKIEPLDTVTMTSIDTDNKLLKSSSAAYVVTDKTAFIQVDEYGDPPTNSYINKAKKVTWDAVKNNKDIVTGATVTFYADGKEVVLALIDTAQSLSSDQQVGAAVGGRFGIGGGDWAIKLIVDGTTKQYTLDDAVDDFGYSNTLVIFKLNSDGEIDYIETADDNVDGYFDFTSTIQVASTKSVDDKLVISDGTNEYIVKKAQVKYFDKTGASLTTASGVSKGDYVILYDILDKDGDVASASSGDNAKDGIYDFVVIVD